MLERKGEGIGWNQVNHKTNPKGTDLADILQNDSVFAQE